MTPVARTRDGSPWSPTYLDSVDSDSCIGCGRCYKVCGRGVLMPIEKDDDGGDDDESMVLTVMTVVSPGSCIGCAACGRVCARRAQRFTGRVG